MKGRYNNGDANVGNGNNDINVYINGALLYSELNVSSNNACPSCWSSRTSPVWVANSSVVTLLFTTTNPLGGDRTTFLDNVMVNSLPPSPPSPPLPPNPPYPPPAVPTNVSVTLLLVGSSATFSSVVSGASAQLPAALGTLVGADLPVALVSLSPVARRRRSLLAASGAAVRATFLVMAPSLQAAQAVSRSLSAASSSSVSSAFAAVLPGLVSATMPNPPVIAVVAAPPRSSSAVDRDAAIGGGVGGGGAALCLMGAAAAFFVRRRRHAAALPAWDVFLSYRRIDAHVLDSFADKVMLCGLRVFHDRSGAIVGRAFEAELFRAVRSSAAFTPVITLAAIRGFGAAGAPGAPVDYMLAECLIALHCKHVADAEGSTRLIYPLVVGPEEQHVEKAADTSQQQDKLSKRIYLPLLHTDEYKAAVAALPDAVPLATVALVDSVCRRELGMSLAPALARATVRQLLLCSPSTDAGQHLTGLLGYDACIVEGPVLMLDAVVRGRFVPFVTAQLHPPQSGGSKVAVLAEAALGNERPDTAGHLPVRAD